MAQPLPAIYLLIPLVVQDQHGVVSRDLVQADLDAGVQRCLPLFCLKRLSGRVSSCVSSFFACGEAIKFTSDGEETLVQGL
jgi:hypothetical protein